MPRNRESDALSRAAIHGGLGGNGENCAIRRVRLALAVHYTVPIWTAARRPVDRPPRWFAWTLSNRPEIAAEVLARSVLSKLRRGANSPVGIHELAHSPDHARVARLITMPLLRQFPVRCASGQLSSLDHLLLTARRHCDIDPFLALIGEKHADSRMSVRQRVRWLACGRLAGGWLVHRPGVLEIES